MSTQHSHQTREVSRRALLQAGLAAGVTLSAWPLATPAPLWGTEAGTLRRGGHLWRLLGFETHDEADRFLADHNAGHNYILADLEETVKPLDNLASNAGHLQ
jgi:hypothetical protein